MSEENVLAANITPQCALPFGRDPMIKNTPAFNSEDGRKEAATRTKGSSFT